MIVEALLTALFAIIGLIVSLFNFPAMPEALQSVWNTVVTYLSDAYGMLYFIFDFDVVKITLGFLIALFAIEKGIDIFLWVWEALHGKVGD